MVTTNGRRALCSTQRGTFARRPTPISTSRARRQTPTAASRRAHPLYAHTPDVLARVPGCVHGLCTWAAYLVQHAQQAACASTSWTSVAARTCRNTGLREAFAGMHPLQILHSMRRSCGTLELWVHCCVMLQRTVACRVVLYVFVVHHFQDCTASACLCNQFSHLFLFIHF